MNYKHAWFLAGAAAVATCASPAANGQIIFMDDYGDLLSAANYTQVSTGENAVTFAFDYSTMGIPPAPNTTDASTLGVKFESNMTGGAVAAVTLHTNQQLTGPYVVKFDAWINANGPFPGGGAGSTEFVTGGVGGDGATANLGSTSGSGGWTAVDGEGGSSFDYRLYKGSGLQDPASGQYAAGTEAGANNNSDPYYAQFGSIDVANLPVQGANNGGPAQQNGTTAAGSAGFEWHEVKLVVNPIFGPDGGKAVVWFIDGLLIGTLDAGIGTSFSTDGSVTIGYMDPFTSVSDNATLSFGLIDNLVVVPEPAALLLGTLGLVLLSSRRRFHLGQAMFCGN